MTQRYNACNIAASYMFGKPCLVDEGFLCYGDDLMINGYTTVGDKAKEWELTTRTVQSMCADGRIPGAVKFGKVWAIPADTIRPTDSRLTSGLYKNWRKRGAERHDNASV